MRKFYISLLLINTFGSEKLARENFSPSIRKNVDRFDSFGSEYQLSGSLLKDDI